ncbi:CHRD domain-containing protein [Sinorhizobium alkalisoli]|uniref:CHRD domain-containing protein n=1 Tax=Sinorhizobium alkalisoli TaxID=1752398 RepID=UPI00124E7BA0|nr:CHRD domain-containing protein [Sinorhizobium alkalisoli]MCA1492279.1 CHRD domain-containing protein [Ensifer sp. NBAIM29]QFI66382.1 hypothetical protein EKH55_1508 [Sinorhizobium alkalisoli]
MQSWTKTTGIVVALGYLAAASMGFAEEMKFKAELKGSEEVPPVETSATGTADVTYDTESKNLTWTIEHSGLSGDVTAAHFHGPAASGENAPPMVPIEVSALSEGSATLDDTQAAALTEGRLYVNLHTAAHPDGEIRGQVMKAE